VRAFVLVDLGFGDAGKGLLTDYLVRRTGATMVVRYNGGAQAGHNVVAPDGQHHTFAQFGAGTFVPGVRTFLSRDVIVHPTALFREEAHLRSVGVTDALQRLTISADALVITPYHQELNRLRELARGAELHGSCGVGVGETVGHDLATGDGVRMRDLLDRATLRAKLERIRDYAREVTVPRIDQWIDEATPAAALIGDDSSWHRDTVVFEGAQGVLLDQQYGFHPHTTWSTCTSENARRLLAGTNAVVTTIGILRTYAVRHGAGPLPTESEDVRATPFDHNTFNPWQGAVRRGWFDATLARYAIEADAHIDALAITHLDWLPRIPRWTYSDGALRHCAANEGDVLRTIEEVTGKPVAFGSRGPTSADVFPEEANRGVDRRCEVGRP